nr:MAG: Putative binding domain, N-terminal [Bacteriophage sp.]
MEETLFKLARAITDTGTDTVSSEGGTITYRITSLKRKLVNGKVVSTSTPSCTLGSAPVSWAIWRGVTVGDGYLDVKINYLINIGSSRSTTLTFTQNGSNNKINLTVTQKPQGASTFTLSGLPTGRGYYLFGRGARPQNTSHSDRVYIRGLSATGTTTMMIPFQANDSEPGSRIECTTGDKVAVYTKSGATWILEGSFIVPSAGGTVSI